MLNRSPGPTPSIASSYPEWFTQPQGSRPRVLLGVGAFGHDAAAALVEEATGQVLFAVAEERLTNRKHDWHYPVGAIRQCCDEAVRLGRSLAGVAVNYRHDEFVTRTLFQEIDRLAGGTESGAWLKAKLLEHLPEADYFSMKSPSATTRYIGQLLAECGLDDATKATIALRISWYFNWAVKYRRIDETLRQHFSGLPIFNVNHHLAHAASAYYNSGYDEATVLVIDGAGEADTVTVYHGQGNALTRVSQTGWPHSLGIFYLFATQHLGFGLGDEYKVMGMSAYGRPRFFPQLEGMMSVNDRAQLVLRETEYQHLVNLGGTGHLAYQFSQRLGELLPARKKEAPFRQEHFDFAASVQQLTEKTGVALAEKAMALTGSRNLAIAGGVGLNGLMNEAIRQRSGCHDIFIYPAAGDDGTAVGAAQWLAAQTAPLPKKRLRGCYFGREARADEASRVLNEKKIAYSQPESIHAQIAAAIADGKIVARCVGRAEFGPRALGHRSILAHPGLSTMKETLNLRVKHREEFRPFAPACLREDVKKYFHIDVEAPFMLLITQATPHAHRTVPSVVHQDGTARVQSVSASEHPDFYQTLVEFKKLTGLSLLLNTSFNVNGETIVDSPLDALESFGFMDIDYLALGPYWISKEENASRFPSLSHDDYLDIRRQRYQQQALGELTTLDIAEFDESFLDVESSVDHFMKNHVLGRDAASVWV